MVPALTSPAMAPKETSISLIELLMKGGYLMIPIGILSLIAIYVLIERYMAIRKASHSDNNFMNNIKDFIKNGNIEAARSLCKNSTSPQARMIEKGISRMGKPVKEIEASIENTGKLEVYKLEKNLAVLGIIAGIAPMFGFIGTIMGVIKIFYNISLADNISIGLISGGLYEKMITSAAGLVVGVFAFIAYHWLNIMVDKVIQRMETNSIEFIDLLQE
jgi:biopolymer transport protein ExbB